jgi:hypothetical protein
VLLLHAGRKHQAYRPVCNECVYCANDFIVGSSNLSFARSCAYVSVAFEAEIISLSVDYRLERTFEHTCKCNRECTCYRLRLKCDGTRAETRFRLSAKRTSPFKSAGASGLSTTGSRGVRINGSNAGYTMFRGSVKSTGYPLYSPVYPSLHLPCVTVCHHISTGLYL